MKHLLQEAYMTTKKLSGIDPSRPGNLRPLLANDEGFNIYVEGLSEGLSQEDADAFKLLAENTRINLLENSMYQINPYETLSLPVLRVFYPSLVAREAVTVEPIDAPEVIKPFLRIKFQKNGSATQYAAPAVNTDISGGPSIGTPVSATMDVPSTAFDVLGTIGLTSDQSHLERDFVITGVSADGVNYVDVAIRPAVEGHFSASVTLDPTTTDVISGKVDYLNGTVDISSTDGHVIKIRYEVTCSLEENKINPKAVFTNDKIRLYAKDREISAQWSIQMEQDMKALFDVSVQAEIVNIIAQQIALDTDREIINNLIIGNSTLNPTTHQDAFSKTPPSTYVWGTKYWHENIITVLNTLGAQIYNDINIGEGNTILANPLDAAILEDLNTFSYNGSAEMGGDLGYRSATVASGKWKVLVSSVVPQGQMPIIYKPVEAVKAVYFYAPYVPAILSPYPLGAIPSITILSRYATSFARANGVSVLNIT